MKSGPAASLTAHILSKHEGWGMPGEPLSFTQTPVRLHEAGDVAFSIGGVTPTQRTDKPTDVRRSTRPS